MSLQEVVVNKPGVDHSCPRTLEHRPRTEIPDPELEKGPKSFTSSPEALRVLDLHKSFRSGFLRRRIRGVQGVSFTVGQGEVFALLGHNGAGKTTTINCILDLVHPDSGDVSIFKIPSQQVKSRARIGYLPERPYFFEHLTGLELLTF